MRRIVANFAQRKFFSVACSPTISSYRINSKLEDCLIKGIGRSCLKSNHLLCIGIEIKVF